MSRRFYKTTILRFLKEYYIDTLYYISKYGEFIMEARGETIGDVDKKAPEELIHYLDIERLSKDEEDILSQIENEIDENIESEILENVL